MPALTNTKHERFCQEYVIDFNASAAGVRVGYTPEHGRRLLRDVTVKARIDELTAEVSELAEITAERIALAYAHMAFHSGADLAEVMDTLVASDKPGGQSLGDALAAKPLRVHGPIKEMTARVDAKGAVTYSVKAHDRYRALDVLAERYWLPAEVNDGLIDGIAGLRTDAGVPDMSEPVKKHNTERAVDDGLDAEPDPAGPCTHSGDAYELDGATVYPICTLEVGHDGAHNDETTGDTWTDSDPTSGPTKWRRT